MSTTTMGFAGAAFSETRIRKVERTAAQLWTTIIWLLGALLVLQGLRSGVAGGITSSDLGAAVAGFNSGSPAANMLYQVVRVVLLLVAVYAVLFAAPLRFERPRLGLFWFGVTASTASMLASAAFGQGLGLSLQLLELPLVLFALWALPVPPFQKVLDSVRRVLLVIAYGSLAYVALFPSLAAQPYFGGLVPGLSLRLHGLTAHANILGAAMGAYLILDIASRRRGGMVWINRFAVLAALGLSQSKTTIGIVLAVFLISAAMTGRQGRGRFFRFLLGVVGIVAGVRIAFTEGNPLSRTISTGSFTGRNVIWDATLDVWQQEPWLGYGPNLWNLAMRAEYLLVLPNPPAHAHNQVVQTLGMFGVVGLVAFILLVLGLTKAAFLGRKVSYGATIGLMIFFAGRSITEPLWFIESLTSTSVIILPLLVILASAAHPEPRVEPSSVKQAPGRQSARGRLVR